jgi:5-(carboxyamino)imidazole ribonucleotide mutase
MKFVSIIIQNRADYEKMKPCFDIFETFSVRYELIISSAIKSKQRTQEYVKNACSKGAVVFITASVEPVHLCACVASHTIHPVIAVGLSVKQPQVITSMPKSFPIAHVQLGEQGVCNAAYLAMQILALHDKELAAKLIEDRIVQQKEISTFSKEIEVLV